jgi:hypothetical protein
MVGGWDVDKTTLPRTPEFNIPMFQHSTGERSKFSSILIFIIYLLLNVNKNLRIDSRETPAFPSKAMKHKKRALSQAPFFHPSWGSLKSLHEVCQTRKRFDPRFARTQDNWNLVTSLPRDIGDLDAPPPLFNGLLAGIGGWIPVTGPAVLEMVTGLVHRAVLPEFRFLGRTATSKNKSTQENQHR